MITHYYKDTILVLSPYSYEALETLCGLEIRRDYKTDFKRVVTNKKKVTCKNCKRAIKE